ncbi:hypothetical protein MA16_Dca014917 [Dendrobium catenatum]|uniref:DUF4283 domain-containing protein n=1 Tax=Dendrobium catenatum TaxID=906689 RepID=A0A2I0WSK5_9ASPA|nr:hypothetical protein MA16_Dca014917 [Dendrobium catenatum]
MQVMKFTEPEGKFSPGITSSIAKPTAVRELIMSSIGISSPATAARVFGPVATKAPNQGAGDHSNRSQSDSPRGSNSDMEDDRDACSEREASSVNEMEESGQASGSQIDMEDDQDCRAETQLQALTDVVCPALREATAWADCTEEQAYAMHPVMVGPASNLDGAMVVERPADRDLQVSPDFDASLCGARLSMGMDDAMRETKAVSNRCEPQMDTAMSSQVATDLCTQGACENVPKAQNSAWHKPQPSQALSQPPNGLPRGPFAWSKVQQVPLNRLSRDQWVAKDGLCIEPELGAINDNISKLDMAIVAKVMGRRISYPFLLEELKRRWYHFGDFEIITIAPNTFICLFQSHKIRDTVLSSGPSIVAENIIGMNKWTSTLSPFSLHGLHSPIWVRLPQLPLIYWDINNITRIANGIGEPLWMDSHIVANLFSGLMF